MNDRSLWLTLGGGESSALDADRRKEWRRQNLERWSGRLVGLSGLLLVLVIAWNAWRAYSQWQHARAVRCDHPVFGFGRVFVGDVVNHTFHLTNVGRSTLQIMAIHTDCGCTTVAKELKGRTLAPEQAVDVPVTLSALRGSGEEVVRKVVIEFAGEPAFKVMLHMKGHIDARWQWSPAEVSFDTVTRNDTKQRTVILKERGGGPPALVTGARTTGSLFDATVRNDVDSDGSSFIEISITTTPPLPVGSHRAELYFFTSGTEVPTGPIPISVNVVE